MNRVSRDEICVYHLWLFAFFPGVFLSSRVTGACLVTTDLIVRQQQQQQRNTWVLPDMRQIRMVPPASSQIQFDSKKYIFSIQETRVSFIKYVLLATQETRTTGAIIVVYYVLLFGVRFV